MKIIKRFEFGKNWDKYIKEFYDEDKLKEAIKSLRSFTKMGSFKNKTFIDIGCGSGLFSLAAYNMKAKSITSLDIDNYSVKCTEFLKNKEGNPKNWVIMKGSILNKNLILKKEKADIVYSWGVLHHTGKMWSTIDNSMKLVKDKGYLYIALYNKRDKFISSKQWLTVKKIYNKIPRIGKLTMELAYILVFFIKNLLLFKKPISRIKNYKSNRGMSWKRDITDWLGGYPYEYATKEEVINFCNKKGFILINIKDVGEGTGCNEFLFKKR